MKNSFISAKWNDFFKDGQSDAEWLSLKISMSAILCIFLTYILFTRQAQPFPSGVCQFFDCSCLAGNIARVIVIAVLLATSLLYVFEVKMLFSTFTLFALSVIILSLEESNGNPAESGMVSLVFFAQFSAYLLNRFKPGSNLAINRFQFSAQVIGAAYTLSGISKLNASGLAWFTGDAPKFALEVLRVFYSKYVTYGDAYYQAKGSAIATFVLNHLLFTKLLLFSSLLIELCAVTVAFSKKASFFYSFLLLALHLGIYLTLDIFFATITLPMVIFFINPLYWILLIISYLRRYFNGRAIQSN